MKVCARCHIEKEDSEFKKVKCLDCTLGYYYLKSCKDCLRIQAKEYTLKKKLENPNEFNKKASDRVRKWQKTEKGKINKKKQQLRYRDKNREYYFKNSKAYYKNRLNCLKKQIETISDEYIITQLQNPNRKIQYTRNFLKLNPNIIEEARIRILNTRIKKKIEEVSDYGICRICKKYVLKTEFKIQKATDKKKNSHIERLCRQCQKELSIKNWNKHKNKTNEKYNCS